MQRFKEIDVDLRASPDQQISLTAPDARSMNNRDGGIVGYIVQTAVDAKHHLIVAHEVTTVGHDRTQLAPMVEQARQAIGTKALTVLADRGYYNGEQIRQCEQQGMKTLVPKPLTSGNKAAGLFDKRDFLYLPQHDAFRCPAGPSL